MVAFRLSRWIGLTSFVILIAVLPGGVVGAQQCSATLADLRQVIEPSVIGVAVGCARVDADGNTLQPTTTGLAIYRGDGTAVFASGDQHWALTDQGLQTWTANWHNGLYPPTAVSAETGDAALHESAAARIRPMTLLQAGDGSNAAVLRDDASGSSQTVQLASSCPALSSATGDHVFVRSDGLVTDLVLVGQHQTCAVASPGATDNY
jgi:hypothetical protein